MIDVALVDAMSAAGWSYDEASHGFTLPDAITVLGASDLPMNHLWVSWQQAVDMLAAAERGRAVEAAEVLPISRTLAEHLNQPANDA